LAFQDEEIDVVTSITRIENAKKQLERIEKKEVKALPTVKRFLDKVEEDDGKFYYQTLQCIPSKPLKSH
jgi:hypothetical protein